MKKIVIMILTVMGSYLISFSISAADIGAPIKIADTIMAEIIYEKYKRNVEYSSISAKIIQTSGTSYITIPEHTDKQEEDRFLLRINVPIGVKSTIHGDLGTTESKESTGSVPLFGVGLKHIAFDKNDSRISVFLQGHYAPEIEYKKQESTTMGLESSTQKESYYEISTGLTMAKIFLLDSTTQLIPYGGVMLSYLKGKDEFKATYSNSTTILTANSDMNSDGLFALVLGTDLRFESNLGIHLEGRFANQNSLSIALYMSF